MPAPLVDVDWSAVRATYAATGCDAAATAAAHGIADPASVRQRAKRGQWRAANVTALSRASMRAAERPAVSVNAVTAPDAIQRAYDAEMAGMSRASRLSMARAVSQGVQAAAEMSGEEVLAVADKLKALAGVGQVAHPAWREDAAPKGPLVSLTFNGSPIAEPILHAQVVEAEVLPVSTGHCP